MEGGYRKLVIQSAQPPELDINDRGFFASASSWISAESLSTIGEFVEDLTAVYTVKNAETIEGV